MTPHEPDAPLDATPLPMLSVEDARVAAAAAGIPEVLVAANVLRFALRHEKVARVLADIVDVAVLHGALDARLREIAILRVGWRIGSVYEWSNHVPIGRRAGLTDDDLLAIRSADLVGLSPGDRLAVNIADEVLDANVVSPHTLAAARQLLGDGDALLELVAIPGYYRAIGSMLATFSVPLEAHVDRWAPDGKGPGARPADDAPLP
jgi:alkylhydroperoxidase family enzyme